MEYGLIGYPLKHSYSKIIHEDLDEYQYDIYPISAEALPKFINGRQFKGLNVTIPYKEVVIPFLDELDETVRVSGTCNTIINQDGRLVGYNTDIDGFIYMLKANKIELKDRIVAVLGDGATSKTVRYACTLLGAKEIIFTSRKGTLGSVTIGELTNKSIDVIINTTSVGLYPNVEESLLDLTKFSSLYAVVDVVYNPLSSKMILQAKSLNIKCCGGLLMLVAQAFYAGQLFAKKKFDETTIRALYFHLYSQKLNVVLIGMPMSGKSSIGKVLAKLLNKEFVDMDIMIEDKQHLTINEIFALKGEGHFRVLEANLAKQLAMKNDLIISTGGGVVQNLNSVELLKQNGILIYLTRAKDKLKYNDRRPTIKDEKDYEFLLKQREAQYLKAMDLKFDNNGSVKTLAENIKEAIYESIDYQWS